MRTVKACGPGVPRGTKARWRARPNREGKPSIGDDGNETVKKAAKDKTISADDEKRANEEIQALTDAQIKRVEELFKAKEKEVLTI